MDTGSMSVRPQPPGGHAPSLPAGPYGVPEQMLHGFKNAKEGSASRHPLEHSEKHWHENKMQTDFQMLRNTQGMHAPLKLQMERHIASKMQRLPGLHSSNILHDTLSGRDELIDFDDILNNPAEAERMGQTHILMEKRLDIL